MECVDFVVLWVDDTDLEWRRERDRWKSNNKDNGTHDNRYRDWGLMKYWFRGVEQFAPWVNRVFFVTNGQVPPWLNQNHPKIRLVRHEDYIPKEYLPTFNSNVIELWLHKIPDLSEHFVLFNDDMFLAAPVLTSDFFKCGLPYESALMDMASAADSEDCLPHMQINNFAIINKYFNKQEVIKKNFCKFFNIKYRKDLLRNILLVSFKYFSCFRDSHIPTSYLKSTFVSVWEKEGVLIESCSLNKFRSKSDVTHWLMKSWQICEGKFEPRDVNWGCHYELWEDDIEQICNSIISKKYRVVCLNDSKQEIDFDLVREKLEQCFEYILPEKSSFEIL